MTFDFLTMNVDGLQWAWCGLGLEWNFSRPEVIFGRIDWKWEQALVHLHMGQLRTTTSPYLQQIWRTFHLEMIVESKSFPNNRSRHFLFLFTIAKWTSIKWDTCIVKIVKTQNWEHARKQKATALIRCGNTTNL